MNSESKNKMKEVQNSVTVLKGVYTPFDSLLTQIRTNWGKENFKENLKNAVLNFPKEAIGNLNSTYETMNIKSDIQLKEFDIDSLININSANELKQKIDSIKEKITKINIQLQEQQSGILKEYKAGVKELVKRKSEAKEKQLEVLDFMKKVDLI